MKKLSPFSQKCRVANDETKIILILEVVGGVFEIEEGDDNPVIPTGARGIYIETCHILEYIRGGERTVLEKPLLIPHEIVAMNPDFIADFTEQMMEVYNEFKKEEGEDE